METLSMRDSEAFQVARLRCVSDLDSRDRIKGGAGYLEGFCS